jgi:hypothetical protein
MKNAPRVGPSENPTYDTPKSRENIWAREPSEVQSEIYAEIAAWRAA